MTAAARGTTHPDKDPPELVPDETVDEEVGGGVEGEKGVGDGGDAVAEGVTVQLDGRYELVERHGDAQSSVRQFAGVWTHQVAVLFRSAVQRRAVRRR